MSENKELTSIQLIPIGTKEEQKLLVLCADEVATAQYLAGAINSDMRFTAFCIPTASMSTDSMAILMKGGVVRRVISNSED